MNRFWLISSLVFAETLTAPAAHAQTIPGSTGHGAPTFNCAVNETYKDLDSGLVWRCGPTANNWTPAPQFLPWVTPTSGNCPVGNGTTFVSSACGGIGTINNFVFVGDSLTGGLHSSTGNATFGTTTPATGYAAQTTASASANSSTVTVANATGIIVGQHISVSPQSAGAFNIGVPAGALVTSVSGTTIGISINTQVAFTNTAINFYNADYPAVAMTLPNFQGHGTATNYGVAGWTIQLNLNAYFTSVHNLAPAVTGKPGFLFVMMGVNDINVSNSSAATIENLLSQYYTFAQADGWTVVAETILPAPFTAAQALVWQQVNQWIRGQHGLWNRLIDNAALMPNNYDANLFYSVDFEHLSNAGYAMVAHAANEVLGNNESMLGSPQTSPQVFNYGNTFTASGCSSSTLVGGATAGSFHSGVAGACTVVITPGVPAASGWVCRANDLTTNTDSATWSQTASTTTTATISGTTASGDVVNFQCAPF